MIGIYNLKYGTVEIINSNNLYTDLMENCYTDKFAKSLIVLIQTKCPMSIIISSGVKINPDCFEY